MPQKLAQPDRTKREHVSELWREYERFARSDDPFDRTTARILFNAATHMDSVKRPMKQQR
jgi:hypothetical protein